MNLFVPVPWDMHEVRAWPGLLTVKVLFFLLLHFLSALLSARGLPVLWFWKRKGGCRWQLEGGGGSKTTW